MLSLTLRTVVGWSERQRTPTMTMILERNCWSSLALTPTYQIAKVRKVSEWLNLVEPPTPKPPFQSGFKQRKQRKQRNQRFKLWMVRKVS